MRNVKSAPHQTMQKILYLRDWRNPEFKLKSAVLSRILAAIRMGIRTRPEAGTAEFRSPSISAVLPRRSSTLAIADTIASVNEQQLLERDDRVLTLFSSFRKHLWLALLIVVVFGILYASATAVHLLRIERRTISHLMEATQARRELRSLSAELVAAQEKERKNLSRELHDAVGQSVACATWLMSGCVPNMAASPLRNAGWSSTVRIRIAALLIVIPRLRFGLLSPAS